MHKRPLIVFPDADEGDNEIHRTLFEQLEQFSDFRIFEGRPTSQQQYLERIVDADGILLGWDLPTEVLQQTQNLKIISFTGIGADKFIDIPLAKSKNIIVCNCPGYSDNTVAEHTMALLLSVCRKIPQLDRQLRKGNWNQNENAMELRGKTIGLIGFGGIGKRFSHLCQAFGMHVKVWTRSMNPDFEKQFNIELSELEDLYTSCDILSLHLASNPATTGMIDHKAFSAMQPGTLLINTARAELVEQEALYHALKSGQLGAAGLDVFHDEPLPERHPLAQMDNVVITPHIAYNTPEAVESLYNIAVQNIVGFFNNQTQNQFDAS